MKKFVSFSAAAIAAGLVTPDLMAQRDLEAGFSTENIYIDLDAATNEFGSLGVHELNGEIFATTRISPAVGGLHFVSVFDNSGSFLRSWFQPGFAQASEWGYRDGADDGSGLIFGFDFGLQITDINGNLLDGLGGPNLGTQNGPVTVLGGLISGNVLAPEQAGINRGNAYDRTGNGGDGSFWTGNFGSSTFEIDTNGDILTTYANAGEVTYGFGLDPTSRDDGTDAINPNVPATRMWVNSGPDATGALELAEYDLVAGTLTGQTMRGIQGIQGGLDIMDGTVGRGGLAGGYDIIHLQQGGPDEVRGRRLHMDVEGEGIPPAPATRLGTAEPDLLNTIDNEDLWPLNDAVS